MAAVVERLDGGLVCSLDSDSSSPRLSSSPPPDHQHQNNPLLGLPIVAIETVLNFMSYDEISLLRAVRGEHTHNTNTQTQHQHTGRLQQPGRGERCTAGGAMRAHRAEIRCFRNLGDYIKAEVEPDHVLYPGLCGGTGVGTVLGSDPCPGLELGLDPWLCWSRTRALVCWWGRTCVRVWGGLGSDPFPGWVRAAAGEPGPKCLPCNVDEPDPGC